MAGEERNGRARGGHGLTAGPAHYSLASATA